MNCELCDTPLAITVDGVALYFTAHTPENCRLMTLSRIRLLTRLMRESQHEALEQQRMKCEYGRYADRLEGLLQEHDITIPLERWHAEDMEKANAHKMAQLYYETISLDGDLL